MMVSGEPVIAFVDAVRAVLVNDATLTALVTGIYGHVTEAAAVSTPYVVLGPRVVNGDGGAMQRPGQTVTLQLDGWSLEKGAAEIEGIGSRIYALLERRTNFTVPGFTAVDGSLHRDYADYFYEFDSERPQNSMYHMVQRWTVDIHES